MCEDKDTEEKYNKVKEMLEKHHDTKIDMVLGLQQNKMSKYYKTKKQNDNDEES